MRKVVLTMNEQKKYETIKKLVETNGNKQRAAVKLGCTVRTILLEQNILSPKAHKSTKRALKR